MRKKRKRILIIGGSILGGLLVAIAALVGVFLLTMPDSPSLVDLTADDQRPIPDSWFDPVDAAPIPGSRSPIELLGLPFPLSVLPMTSLVLESPSTQPDRSSWTELSGLLRMASDGKPFGQEQFEIRNEGDSVRLSTTGEFFFKVVLVTLRISFQQELVVGRDGIPRSYRLATQAPLGQDRLVEATFFEDTVELVIDGEQTLRSLPLDQAIIIGTFSSYALLPALLAARSESEAGFDVLLFGGPPGADQGGEDTVLPQMSVEHAGVARIASGDVALDVDLYHIHGPLSKGSLYARGDEMLGLTFSSEDGEIDVWRNDYFAEPILSVPLPPSALDR
ncbi:hypothetical protein JW848_01695 [Candidatus Bipolaricaulota bacterium]|nr:hypothetical protein [Candidatus Bipolaricaulota bacterium]